MILIPGKGNVPGSRWQAACTHSIKNWWLFREPLSMKNWWLFTGRHNSW